METENAPFDLKTRFSQSGAGGFSDREILELLLSFSVRNKDVKKMSDELLKTFGSLRGVMTAPVEYLMQVPEIPRSSAVLLNLAFTLAVQCFKEEMQTNPVVPDGDVLSCYLRLLIGDNSCEKVFVLLLDKRGRMIGQWQGDGSRDGVKIDHLQLLKAISFQPGTKSIIIAHNHPSGVCTPSQNDLNTTFFIKTAVAAFDIELKDHLIVTTDKVYSLMNHK